MGTPFRYNTHVYGGTEYMGRGFEEKILPILPKLQNYQCFMMPGPVKALSDMAKDGRPILLWLHNTPIQFDSSTVYFMKHRIFRDLLSYIIVPSEFHKEETIKQIDIHPSKIYVIPNAINDYVYNPQKFNKPDKVKLIHTSSPDRGLTVLFDAVKKIDVDFRLEIYNTYDPDLNELKLKDDRVFFYGRTPRATVKDATEQSHIFAYPSTYPETFCLSIAESMAAGLLPVYPDYGALMEVSDGYGMHYPFEDDEEKHATIFAEQLTKAIETIKSGSWNPEEQIKYINSEYSWERNKEYWLELHNKL